MPKDKKTEKIKVRVFKKPASAKNPPSKIPPKEEPPARYKLSKSEEIKKKKMMISLSIVVIMVIIFITWLALLGKSFDRIEGENGSYWSRLIANLKNNFEDIGSSFDKAKSSLKNVNAENLEGETELEKSIFPETK